METHGTDRSPLSLNKKINNLLFIFLFFVSSYSLPSQGIFFLKLFKIYNEGNFDRSS